ncbi:MAG: DUF2147 domain-containing protein [Flavobacteriaceae bacterium]|jgi:uncharacterized protein (DUF2147 family)|nr:DUF2147 domain-containing protein [Flavobacteriaceae bacterium]
MKKLILTFVLSVFGVFCFAQIEGKWKTIDDETGKEKAIVEIFKKPDGKYYGKIIQLLITPTNNNCVKCTDDRKNKPLIGLEIIRGLQKDDDEFSGGTVVKPETGKTYKCIIKREGNKLKVRGYIGFSLIGVTQIWEKAD